MFVEKQIMACQVVIGDEILNPRASYPAFLWVPVTSVQQIGQNVHIRTPSFRILKKMAELVIVRRAEAATTEAQSDTWILGHGEIYHGQ